MNVESTRGAAAIDVQGEESEIESSRTGDVEVKAGGVKLGTFDIWCLGIMIVIGGQYFGWNPGLAAGVGSYTIALVLVGAAYYCLCACIAEVTSEFFFSGVSYGLCRCAVGFYTGFLVGTAEVMEYIFYVSSSVITLGLMLTSLYPSLLGYEPLIWLTFYVTALCIHIFSGKYFWTLSIIGAVLSSAPLIMFLLGSASFVDLPRNVPYSQESYFAGGFPSFMKTLTLVPWFYVGVETLAMTADDVPKESKNVVSQGQMMCMNTLLVTSIAVYLVTIGLTTTDVVAESGSPLSIGFNLMFDTSSPMIVWLTIPCVYATAFGFMFPYGRLLAAMGASGLYSSQLSLKYEPTNAPWAGLVAGSLLGYMACLAAYYMPEFLAAQYNIAMLGGYFTYSAQCIGYLFLHAKGLLGRTPGLYRSPFGAYGAAFSIFVWCLSSVGIVVYQKDDYYAVIAFLLLVAVATVYYYVFASAHQVLSPEETKQMFRIHVINNVTQKKRRSQKKRSSKKKESSHNSPHSSQKEDPPPMLSNLPAFVSFHLSKKVIPFITDSSTKNDTSKSGGAKNSNGGKSSNSNSSNKNLSENNQAVVNAKKELEDH